MQKKGVKSFWSSWKKGGYLDRNGNCTILIPEVNKKVTPLSEAYKQLFGIA